MVTALLDVDSVLFTVLGYPMSYVEFGGTVLCLWSVWLITRRHMLTWPVGIASALLYLALFYQIRLYADAMEQVYYVVTGIYGWWYWGRVRRPAYGAVEVRYGSRRAVAGWAFLTIFLSMALGAAMSRIHAWAPAIFPAPASYPYLDALTTVMSLVAMWLLARKHVESWIYWIVVDVIGIGLYFAKDVKFISLLYVTLLALATRGWIEWRKAYADLSVGGARG